MQRIQIYLHVTSYCNSSRHIFMIHHVTYLSCKLLIHREIILSARSMRHKVCKNLAMFKMKKFIKGSYNRFSRV